MIVSFANKLAENLFEDVISKEVRAFPKELHSKARRKLLLIHDADALKILKIPPGNNLEVLRGEFTGFYSIRINSQWRITFRWHDEHAYDVSVLDYH